MTRIVLIQILLFALPFLVFAAWRYLVHEARGGEIIDDAPVLVLLAIGSALFAAGLFYLASFEKQGIDGRYVPATYKDGHIEPGHFVRPGESPRHE